MIRPTGSSSTERALSDCPSGKRKYEDERTALTALRYVRKMSKGKPGALPKTVYECGMCGSHHFTSKTIRQFREHRS